MYIGPLFFFRNSLWRVNGGAGQWGRTKPSPVCAVVELEARVRPGGDGRGFVTGAGVVITPVSGLAAVVHVAVAARRAAAPASAAPDQSGHGAPQSLAG